MITLRSEDALSTVEDDLSLSVLLKECFSLIISKLTKNKDIAVEADVHRLLIQL